MGQVGYSLLDRRPETNGVRRLIVAGSTSGGVPDVPRMGVRVREIVVKPVHVNEDFLYLFFPETAEGRAAGKASLDRPRHRPASRPVWKRTACPWGSEPRFDHAAEHSVS
jgi:hypothetical protein